MYLLRWGAVLLTSINIAGCAMQAMSGMDVVISGQVADSVTGKGIPDTSLLLAVDDNGFPARKLGAVSSSDENGVLRHQEFVGWCRRIGPLEQLRDTSAFQRIEVKLTHPSYQPQTFGYVIDEVWEVNPPRAVIDLGTVSLLPASPSAE
jgi:hypothetical protein